ncbi:DNA-binding transcriptional LysR family regulator [Pseudomonas duriflava]|uniref:DNA-binding transcriptional LysR family regulator n=1 Tax=Pseudomonas duriflava TaxID=459528 RepID=A0A562PYT6_9PSED|nr:LysR family transcriptional regulator [Pseudomonas duriflava]TWI49605.1 DNA-binding transcriptional LysR family regulator [Pseudomonas duriflava]
MSLNLRQIEVFRAVMTTGSISGASRLLLVSQPAVSRLLSYTESRIGFSLFERIKGRLYPTPEAKKLFREVESVYAGVQRVNTLAHDLAERSQGSVHIVSSPSIGQMLIPQAITAFRERHPDVKCTFTYLGFNHLRDSLLNQQADLGVVILPMRHPNLEMVPLCRGHLVCILPYNHPLTRRATLQLADLRPYPLISYDRETPFGAVVADMYAACGEPMRIAIEVGSPQNACALVQSGAGLALVDDFSVSSWSQSNFVVRPVAPAPTLVANLVHSRYEPLSKPAQHFVATLRSTMAHHGFQAAEA